VVSHLTASSVAPGGQVDFYRQVVAALGEPDPRHRQAAMPVDPWDAVHALQVVDDARVSAATGDVVRLGPR
jgi:predicted amino acid dehydrogenase